MKMTMEQYILNPMGKRNAVMNAVAREAIHKDYLQRYARIMMREHSSIQYHLYKDDKKNKYIAHIKIPSETVNKFYYDTVLEFTTDQDVKEGGRDLFKYNCRFYSNDPSFVFTYAHVFNTDDLFITDLRSKMSKTALKKAPETTNPTNSVGYVKTIYFAYLFMKARDLNQVSKFEAQSTKLVMKNLIADVEDADEKIAKRQEEGEKLRAKRAKEKDEKDDTKVSTTKKTEIAKKIGPIKKTKTVGLVNTIKATRGSRKKKEP